MNTFGKLGAPELIVSCSGEASAARMIAGGLLTCFWSHQYTSDQLSLQTLHCAARDLSLPSKQCLGVCSG